MEVVVASLSEKNPDTEIFLFGGGGDEKKILDAWESKYPRVRNLAGKKYGFKAELALINHLDVMVSMDSANMHLASITATPTISIWGATHSYCGFRGWRQSDSDMIQLPMSLPPLLCLRRQAVSAGRLSLHDSHQTRSDLQKDTR